MAVIGPRARRMLPVGAGGRAALAAAATRRPAAIWRVRDALLIMVAGFAFLLTTLVTALGAFELQAIDPRAKTPREVVETLVQAGFFLFLIWMIYVLIVQRYRVSWRALGIRSVAWQWLAIVPFIFALLLFSDVLMLKGMVTLFGPKTHWPNPLNATTVAAAQQPVLEALVVLTGVGLTPLAEELLFRGVLYQALRRAMPVWSAALISALIFAAMHLSLVLFVPFALMGFVLAILYERSGSLIPSILLHACNNGIILLIIAGNTQS